MELFDAFELEPGAIVAITGGGGKTSLLFALASEAAFRNITVIATTTTRFTRPPESLAYRALEVPDERFPTAAIRDAAQGQVTILYSGMGRLERLIGYRPETIDGLAAEGFGGIVLIEADGSAGRPFKAPAAHEPVIPTRATHVIPCAGLSVLGQPLDEANVHRHELVSAIADVAIGSPVTADALACVLSDQEGGRKGAPAGAKVIAFLSNPPTDEHVRLGQYVAQRLVYNGLHAAVVGRALDHEVIARVR